MVGFGDIIPAEYLDPKKKDEFLAWLLRLEVDIWTKKYILIYWCQMTGVALTEDMVNYVTGGMARYTRDKG